MKTMRVLSLINRGSALSALLALLAVPAAFSQTIPNPSFEADHFTIFPGYISGNSPITGWTASDPARAGINPGGGSPFADNGTIPNGSQVAFIQSAGGASDTLSADISGMTAGVTYKVTFRTNARGGNAPHLRISIDGTEYFAATVNPVGANFPYWYGAFEFTADFDTQTMQLLNDALGDNTVVVDDFRIAPTSGAWSRASWTGDSDVGIDSQFFYTHAYSFGSSASPTINGVPFTGVPGGNPAVAGRFNTATLANVLPGDANNITGDSAVLATDFVYGGNVPASTPQTINIQGLTPGAAYVATLYTVGWEDPSIDNRQATFSVGEDRLTINQDFFGNNNGQTISYSYTADASGGISIKFAPFQPANLSIHIYGFSNREAVSRFVAPAITAQPKNVVVAKGQPASFTVAASGLPAPTYTWRMNGSGPIGNNSTFTIASVLTLDAGDYDVVVANSVGSVTSKVARLVVGLPMNNPSFEVDTFSVYPGYVSGNGPITGWSSLPNHGVNTAAGPFADNGVIPHGNQVAFMQGDGALSQPVSGFTVGLQYCLHYYENARTGPDPFMEAKLDGNSILAPHRVRPVLDGNDYHEVYSDVFIAAQTDSQLDLIKSNPLGGDDTSLIDNVTFIEIQPGTPPFIGRDPEPVLASVGDSASFNSQGLGSLPLRLQWLKNGLAITGETNPTISFVNLQKPAEADYSLRVQNDFGSITSVVAHLTIYEPIPGLFNTGVDGHHVALADNSVDPHYKLILNPDTGSPDAIVEDSTAFPIVGGPWLANTAAGKWIGPRFNTSVSAVGLYTYRIVLDLTDRDPSTLVIQGGWAVDNQGDDIQVNGVSTGNPPNTAGFGGLTPFAIYGTNGLFVAGSNAVDFVMENLAAPGYTGLRVEITRSNLRIPPGVAPEVTTQPVSQRAAEGDTVTFTAAARGSSPLAYQWNHNGVPLPGQTTLTLTLTSVSNLDSGAYTVTVSNSTSVAVSQLAELCVCSRPVSSVFGTGLDNTRALLPPGATDPHYILAASADASFPGPEAIVVNEGYPIQAGIWLLNGPNSKWIAPQADQTGINGGGNAAGDYTYETSFDLTGVDMTQFTLVGQWATDNTGNDILVNGLSTGITCPGFGSFTPFTLTAANGLVADVNTIDFVMNNAPTSPNPTALRVDLRGLINLQPVVTLSLTGPHQGQVSWVPVNPGHSLQQGPTPAGPWTTIATTSPTPVNLNDTTFFRVKVVQ